MDYSFGYWEYKRNNFKTDLTPYFDIKGNEYYSPLIDYFLMLGYDYIQSYDLGYKGHNIDNWLNDIEKQLLINNNEEFYGDNVCIFFRDDKVRLIGYVDYEQGKDNYCEITVEELRKLTIEWKIFVIRWGIKKIKGESPEPQK